MPGDKGVEPGAELHRSEGAFHERRHGVWRLLPAAQEARQITVVGENYQLRALLGGSGEPAVLWLPQLEGTDEGSELAIRLATARGMAALALLPPRHVGFTDIAEEGWADLVRQRVRAGRAALRLLEQDARPRCLAVMGVSLGGHAAVAVARLERSADVLVAMLAGSADGAMNAIERLEPEASHRSIDAGEIELDLLRPRLASEGTLLVRAWFDDVIPPSATDALAEALGSPSEHAYPAGHDSFRAFLPLAIWRALGFIERACALSH